MASLQDALKRQTVQQEQLRFGRGSGQPAHLAGILKSGSGNPVNDAMGRAVRTEFGASAPQASPKTSEFPAPTPSPSPNPVATAASVSPPASPGEPLGADVETVPFSPEPLDQGLPLPGPEDQIHEGGDTLASMPFFDEEAGEHDSLAQERAEGEEPPIDLGTLGPITLGGEPGEDDKQIELAAQEIAARMLRALHSGSSGGQGALK